MSLQLLSNDHVRQAVSTVLSLASWKSLALILAFVNIKNLPFVWHVSVPVPGVIYEVYLERQANNPRSASPTSS